MKSEDGHYLRVSFQCLTRSGRAEKLDETAFHNQKYCEMFIDDATILVRRDLEVLHCCSNTYPQTTGTHNLADLGEALPPIESLRLYQDAAMKMMNDFQASDLVDKMSICTYCATHLPAYLKQVGFTRAGSSH